MEPTGTADLENNADFIKAACDHGPSQSPFEMPVDDQDSGHHACTYTAILSAMQNNAYVCSNIKHLASYA